MRAWIVLAACLAAVLLGPASGSARADRLDTVQRRGAVVVGVKADYAPFGMYDSQGKLVGIEADLAADLARRLGVALQLVAVTTANRLQKLEQGSVDVVIATLGDTPQRREIATLVEPGYFASGANVLLRPDAGRVRDWGDLAGRPICATQGALFNAETEQRYLVELRTYGSNRDARLALRDGRCVGWLYDDVAILNLLKEPDWAGYRMPLPTAAPTPWAIALDRSEKGGRLERLIGDAVAEWHRTGLIVELLARWGLAGGVYTARMTALWNEVDAEGRLVCRREADGSWPLACREESRITTADVTGLHRLVLAVRDRTGLYFSFLVHGYEREQLARGLLLSVALVVGSILGSLALGLLGAALLASRLPPVPQVTAAVTALCRMTPPLLQLYLVYFGVGHWLWATTGTHVDPVAVAVFCFSLYAGATNATVIAEARASLGAQAATEGWRPALARAWVAVMSSSVNIAKATGMASAIAVPELVYAATGIVSHNGNPDVMINLLLLAYFLLVLAVVKLFELVGRRLVVR